MLQLWEQWHLLQWWDWLTWKHQTLSKNPKHVSHQVVLISQHILPLRILGVSVLKNSHCVGSPIRLLRGILLICSVVSALDRSAKMEGKNHTRVWGDVKSTNTKQFVLLRGQPSSLPYDLRPLTSCLWHCAVCSASPSCQFARLTLKQHGNLNTVSLKCRFLPRTGAEKSKVSSFNEKSEWNVTACVMLHRKMAWDRGQGDISHNKEIVLNMPRGIRGICSNT